MPAAALAVVRFDALRRDCRRIKRPLAELRALEAREAERTRAEDLVRHFD